MFGEKLSQFIPVPHFILTHHQLAYLPLRVMHVCLAWEAMRWMEEDNEAACLYLVDAADSGLLLSSIE